MMRPVRYLLNGKVDHVGTFEQVYMDIACTPQEIEKGLSTHVEIAPTNVLSVIANLTPFSDFNQSPRNMYQVSALWLVKEARGSSDGCLGRGQCQMGKQSMGTPSTALSRRTDNKMVRHVARISLMTIC
jgi:DNA-directed RNA polymerase I subunit RPA2